MPPAPPGESGSTTGFGLDESNHEVPFQISIKVKPQPISGNEAEPTATQKVALGHDTE
jgi:hypothetical protein